MKTEGRRGFVWAIVSVLVVSGAMGGCGDGGGVNRAAVEANNRGVALMGSFDYPGAVAEFDTLVAQYPETADFVINLAVATLNRQGEGDLATALSLVMGVLERDPENARAHYCAGLIRLYNGDIEAALSHYQQVLELDPSDADAAYSVGQCLMQLKRPDEALEWYERAVALDPYLRSAYYRGFQCLQRVGLHERADQWLATFQRLKDNPRARVIEFKYTKMGRKGDAWTVDLPGAADAVTAPEGPVFSEMTTVLSGDVVPAIEPDARASVTVCDIDGDGSVDVYLAGRTTTAAVLDADGGYDAVADHPLAGIEGVRSALWGDVDNNGLVDVYLCRIGANQLWIQESPGVWSNATNATGTHGDGGDTVDGALIDADHDGDLDIFLVNADAPNQLLNNNRNGSFSDIADRQGIGGDGRPSIAVVAADLDADRDLDIVVLKETPPHEVFENRMLWDYASAEGWNEFAGSEIVAAVAADLDVDGHPEVFTVDGDGVIRRWVANANGHRKGERLRPITELPGPEWLGVADVTGNGSLELLGAGSSGWWAAEVRSGELHPVHSSRVGGRAWGVAVRDPSRGPSVVSWKQGGAVNLWAPGGGRYDFTAVVLSGREDGASSLRSNASGIGARVAARTGSRWTALETIRNTSGPGQSLQPLAVGLGGATTMDFLAIDWSDGVYQTEMGLQAGIVHRVTETQRQLSSCPVLFAWDGENYRFVSDVLGVGGVGYALGPPGEYSEPRPRESFLLPEAAVAETDGMVRLLLTEPMEELTYLDGARLEVYDLPPGLSMTLDERMALSAPEATGAPRFYRVEARPVSATNDRGQDVLGDLLERDLKAADVGALDHRFIGRLQEDHVLTLRFDQHLDALGDQVMLIADGWVEYPYSQTNFAAWQAGAEYRAPTLEAQGADGRWRIVHASFGYPAGMPRQMSLPLQNLPRGTTQLRISSNQEVYWDRLVVAPIAQGADAVVRELGLANAVLESVGFARRTTGSQRVPHYDHATRIPAWDTRHQSGYYTRFGEVRELVKSTDDNVAIFGPGEGVALEFDAPIHALPEGWSRWYVVSLSGWCKDMDLHTRNGATVAPVPHSGAAGGSVQALTREFADRFVSGVSP